jgi:hypothetical protein
MPNWHNDVFDSCRAAMKQTTFSDAEFTHQKKQTRRDRFLAEIEAVTPWPALVAALLPYYRKGEGRGRPPVVSPVCPLRKAGTRQVYICR